MLAFMGNNKSALKYLEAASTLYLEEGNIESMRLLQIISCVLTLTRLLIVSAFCFNHEE